MNIKYAKSGLLIIFFCLLSLACTVNSSFAEATAGGSCGEGVIWSFDGKGNLTISGTGSIRDFSASSGPPWSYLKSSITSVSIENGIDKIGSYAFYNFDQLVNVELSNSLTSIGLSSFKYCFKLSNIVLPNSLESIGISAFENCYSMTDVKISYGVKEIGSRAFAGCSGLGSISIPGSAKIIGEEAFMFCRGLTEVSVLIGVKEIGNRAFLGCSQLSSVSMTHSVTSLGEESFSCCEQLSEFTVPNGVKTIKAGTFSDCGSLSTVKIHGNVISIEENAFKNCVTLSNVSLPESLSYLGDYSFSRTGIKTIVIPSTVKSIGNYAFYYGNLESLCLSDGIECIGYNAFGGCRLLSNIVIPDSVKSIGDYAFSACENVIDVHLSKNLQVIADGTFLRCYNLENVNMFYGITEIGRSAFSYCQSLKKIDIPNSVKTIGESAFDECESLESINIPENVEQIGAKAFYFCRNLQSISLPSNLTNIRKYCFGGCISLKNITIPKNVSNIEDFAFCECDGLEKIVFLQRKDMYITLSSSAFSEIYSVPLVYCFSDSSAELFANDKGWPVVLLDLKVADSFDLNRTEEWMMIEENINLEATNVFPATSEISIKWASSNSDVASVNQTGFVMCRVPGDVTISAIDTISGIKRETILHVFPQVTGIEIDPLGFINVNEKKIINVHVIAGNQSCENHFVSYSSNTPSVAMIDETTGEIEGVSHGDAMIDVVARNGVSASITVGVHTSEIDSAIEATCEEYGLSEGYHCITCSKILVPQEQTPPKGHDWSQPEYEWNDDNSRVVASRVCSRNPEHIEMEEAGTTRHLIAEPTETHRGAYQIISNQFENSAFKTQIKRDLVIPAINEMNVLRMPSSLKVIEGEAFSAVSAQAIILPDSCTTILTGAFSNCPNLLYVRVPAGTEVSQDAFMDCPYIILNDDTESENQPSD